MTVEFFRKDSEMANKEKEKVEELPAPEEVLLELSEDDIKLLTPEPDQTQFIYDEAGAPVYNGTSFVRNPDEAAEILAKRAKLNELAPKLTAIEQDRQAELEKIQAKYDKKVEDLTSSG